MSATEVAKSRRSDDGLVREVRGAGNSLIRPRVTIVRDGDHVVARRPGVTRWTGVWVGLMGLLMLPGAIAGQAFMIVLIATWVLFSWRLVRMARLSIGGEAILVRRLWRDRSIPTGANPRFAVVERRGFYGTRYRALAVETPSGEVATASAFSSGSGTGSDGWLREIATRLNEALALSV